MTSATFALILARAMSRVSVGAILASPRTSSCSGQYVIACPYGRHAVRAEISGETRVRNSVASRDFPMPASPKTVTR